jgi:hypothetical protein
VDLYHARQHLHDLARVLEFMLLDRKDEWLAARLEDLDYGDIGGICNGPGLLREQRTPDALQVVPLPRPVHRLRNG